MNKEQTRHLNRILEDTKHELTEKYVKGAEEHQSTLSLDYSALELMGMLIEEILDMTTYAHTLREKLREMTEEK